MSSRSFLVCSVILASQVAAIVLRSTPPPNVTSLTLRRDVVRDLNLKCQQTCGEHDADSKCITGCEADLYRCHNHNITVPEGKKKYEKCESRVLNKYKYQSALARLVANKARNVTHLSRADKDKCKDVCSANWQQESKCGTSCEAALYRCHNYNITVPEGKKLYEDCERDVLREHKASDTNLVARKASNISGDLADASLARSRGFDAGALQRMKDSCHSVCGQNPSSSCLTGCEVELYQCRDHNSTQPEGKAAREACEAKALEKWQAFAQGMDLARSVAPNATASFSHLRTSCLGVCDVNASQGCRTGCEVELYQCMDHKVFSPACEKKVLDKYRASGAFYASGDPPGHYGVRLEQLKAACQHACGGKMDSSCQTRCEVDMYHCMDHNHTVPEGRHEYDHCVKDTLEKFRDESGVETHLLSKTGAPRISFDAVACDGVCARDRSCLQGCKADMQQCGSVALEKNRHQQDRAGRSQDACKTRVATKYKKLASKSGAAGARSLDSQAKPSRMK